MLDKPILLKMIFIYKNPNQKVNSSKLLLNKSK